jgi:hypothetical protein
MLRAVLLMTASVALVFSAPVQDPEQPHLAQAWQAQSMGDGLPGKVGLVSYLYQPGREDDGSVRATKWDYGATNCIKYVTDAGFKSPMSGTYYVACDAVDCCVDESGEDPPDVMQYDIPKQRLFTKVAFTGYHDTTELNNVTVKHAETWSSEDHIPFTKIGVNHTYFITREAQGIVTHRIDYKAPQIKPGSILYGNFTIIQPKDIDNFKNTFMPPAACLKTNVLTCDDKKVKEWNRKWFKHEAAKRGWS